MIEILRDLIDLKIDNYEMIITGDHLILENFKFELVVIRRGNLNRWGKLPRCKIS